MGGVVLPDYRRGRRLQVGMEEGTDVFCVLEAPLNRADAHGGYFLVSLGWAVLGAVYSHVTHVFY